jgi:beta-phosphoglucomutase-like phosphatase (HAD superfamily)
VSAEVGLTIRTIIFDFNGVIADDETPHVVCLQQALSEFGLSLTKEEYYGTYLGMDERTCTTRLLTARDGICDETLLQRIMRRKADLFRIHTARHKPELFSGGVDFVKAAAPRYCLAIASGGRREQIEYALRDTAIEKDFEVIVSAEDCPVGKPDPAIYLLTLKLLNGRHSRPPLLTARECLVVEDSKAGLLSARAAGMAVLALATTYPADQLDGADLVLPNLRGTAPENLCQKLTQVVA